MYALRTLAVLAMAIVASALPSTATAFEQEGKASWYGPGFDGRTAASGEIFNQNAMTAAHKTLPFGTRVRVVDLESGRSVCVRINDRGPYHGGRIIDLSKAAATKLDIIDTGTARVRLIKVSSCTA